MDTKALAEEIYRFYPRKIGKRAAVRAIGNALERLRTGELERPMPIENCFSCLMIKTKQFADSPAGNRGMFTPHPSTWFNQSRYLDDEAEWFRENERPRQEAGTGETSEWMKEALAEQTRMVEQMKRNG